MKFNIGLALLFLALLVTRVYAGDENVGRIISSFDSDRYTFIEHEDNEGISWLAVMRAKVNIGDVIRYPSSAPFNNFEYKPLNKSFTKIRFAPKVEVISKSVDAIRNDDGTTFESSNTNKYTFDHIGFVKSLFSDISENEIYGVKKNDSLTNIIKKLNAYDNIFAVPTSKIIRFHYYLKGYEKDVELAMELVFDQAINHKTEYGAYEFTGTSPLPKSFPNIDEVNLYIKFSNGQSLTVQEETFNVIKHTFEKAGFMMHPHHSFASDSDFDFGTNDCRREIVVNVPKDVPDAIYVGYQYLRHSVMDVLPEEKKANLDNIEVKMFPHLKNCRLSSHIDSIRIDISKDSNHLETKLIEQVSDAYKSDLSLIKFSLNSMPTIVIKNKSSGSSSLDEYLVYVYNKSRNTYLGLNPIHGHLDLLDLNKNGTHKLIYFLGFLATGHAKSDTIDIPIVFDFIDDKFINVTDMYRQFIQDEAKRHLTEFKQNNNAGSLTDLFGYMVCKYILGEDAEAWKQFDLLYSKKDKAKLKRTLLVDIIDFVKEYKKTNSPFI